MSDTIEIEIKTHLRWGCGYATATMEGWSVGRYLVLFGFVIPLGWR